MSSSSPSGGRTQKRPRDDGEDERRTTRTDADMVVLNVGGWRCTTTVTTLCQFDGPLRAMFSGSFAVPKQEDGSVFIDRDGSVVKVILNYMRSARVNIPPTLSAAQVQTELDYFLADPPQLAAEETGCDLFQGTMCYRTLRALVAPLKKCMDKAKAKKQGYNTYLARECMPGAFRDLTIRLGEWPPEHGVHETIHMYYYSGPVRAHGLDYSGSFRVSDEEWNLFPEAMIGDICSVYYGRERNTTLQDVRTVLTKLIACHSVYVACGKMCADDGTMIGESVIIRVFYEFP